MAWFCNLWIAVLTVTYIKLSLQFRDQKMKEMKTATLKPLILQGDFQRTGENGTRKQLQSLPVHVESQQTAGGDSATETSQWNELYTHRKRNNTKNETHQPRVFLSSPKEENSYNRAKRGVQNKMELQLSEPPSSKKIRHKPPHKPDCVEKAEWHSFNFQNCNTFHEIDFVSGLAASKSEDTRLGYKFRGGTRETWLYEHELEKHRPTRAILKTLRWIKDYDEVRFDHQRIDSLALERLTGSPHIVETYGYCGMAALNEFAGVGHFGRFYAINHANVSSSDLLAYARDAALGLADVHEIEGTKGSKVSTLVHHDLSPKNLVLTTDGKIKLSDFNDGQLLHWNFEKHKRCKGFDWDNLCGTTVERTNRRAPEECTGGNERYGTTERTEVYHLGTIFHFMLSKEQFPYRFVGLKLNGTLYQPDPQQVKNMILNGIQPPLPPEVEESRDPAIQTLLLAMRKALTFDAKKRPSSREIADILDQGTSAHNVNEQLLENNKQEYRKAAANNNVKGFEKRRHEHGDKELSRVPKGRLKPKESKKPESVFAVNDEFTFDPYSAAGHF